VWPVVERAIEAFAAEPNGGLIVELSATARYDSRQFYGLAIKHRLPTLSYSGPRRRRPDGLSREFGRNVSASCISR
jgi:hypothetical protein